MSKILPFLLLLFSVFAFAAEDNDDSKPDNDSVQQTEPKKNRDQTQVPDSFTPTETLSKDLPAIFPADI